MSDENVFFTFENDKGDNENGRFKAFVRHRICNCVFYLYIYST